MSTPFVAWIQELFPIEEEPFSMRVILERLRVERPRTSRSATYRALRALQRSSATRDRVRALNEGDEKTRLYNAEAAQLIGRWATRKATSKKSDTKLER